MVVETRRRSRARSVGSAQEDPHEGAAPDQEQLQEREDRTVVQEEAATPTRRSTQARKTSSKLAESTENTSTTDSPKRGRAKSFDSAKKIKSPPVSPTRSSRRSTRSLSDSFAEDISKGRIESTISKKKTTRSTKKNLKINQEEVDQDPLSPKIKRENEEEAEEDASSEFDSPKDTTATTQSTLALSPASKDELTKMQMEDVEISAPNDPQKKPIHENDQNDIEEMVDDTPAAMEPDNVAENGRSTEENAPAQLKTNVIDAKDEDTTIKTDTKDHAVSGQSKTRSSAQLQEDNEVNEDESNGPEKSDIVAKEEEEDGSVLRKMPSAEDELTESRSNDSSALDSREGEEESDDDDDDDDEEEEEDKEDEVEDALEDAHEDAEEPVEEAEAAPDSKTDGPTRNSAYRRKRGNRRNRGPKNELSSVLPGYTAPMRLQTTWTQRSRSANILGFDGRTLEELRPKNELSSVLPGYTAPMRPQTTWTQRSRSANISGFDGRTLEELRRKAMREDKANIKQNASARLMAERSTTGNLTVSYQQAHANASQKKGKKKRLTSDTAGEGWFNMKATPMTEEMERDLALIRNRNYLDPKRFYKSADRPRNGTKPILQAGTVIEGPTEFYSSRLTKKQRRSNLVDEVMADPESSTWVQQKHRKMHLERQTSAKKWSKNVSNPKEYRKPKAR